MFLPITGRNYKKNKYKFDADLPVEHALELRRVDHVAFEGGEEDLRGVAEHDDTKGDREGQDVDAEGDLRPTPVFDPKKIILNFKTII